MVAILTLAWYGVDAGRVSRTHPGPVATSNRNYAGATTIDRDTDAIQHKSATAGARGSPADNCDAAADNGYVASAAHNTEAFQPSRR
jgi:hypothetical protein